MSNNIISRAYLKVSLVLVLGLFAGIAVLLKGEQALVMGDEREEFTVNEVEDFHYTLTPDRAIIHEYTGEDTVMEIPGEIEELPVGKLGEDSFRGRSLEEGLEEVTIPDSVEVIGQSAFAFNDLTSVTIPESVEVIDIYAFRNNDIETVTLSENLEIIESGVFMSNDITEVEIPEGVKIISHGAFWNNNLNKVYFPDSVEKIETNAFLENKLTEIIFGNNISEIRARAFQDNDLTEVTITDLDVEFGDDIGSEAFADNDLTKITIAEDISISEDAFDRNHGDFVTDYQKMDKQAGTYEYCDENYVWELTDDEYYEDILETVNKEEIEDIEVNLGTSAEDAKAKLLEEIGGELEDKTEVTLDINWSADENYHPQFAIDHTFEGTLQHREGEEGDFIIPGNMATVEAVVTVEPEYKRGDITGNGEIEVEDAIKILQYVVGLEDNL